MTNEKSGQNLEHLLDVLRCPITLSRLHRDGDHLVAEVGGLRYPIRDGIPQMIAEDATLPDGVASLDDLRKALEARGVELR